MKYLILFSSILLCAADVISQIKSDTLIASTSKPLIDTGAIRQWPTLGYNVAISNDGNYLFYSITNKPVGRNTLIIRHTKNLWQKEIIGVNDCFFSGDSKQAIFKSKDTLYFLELGSANISYVTNVSNYKFCRDGTGEWMAYKVQDSDATVILRNLYTAKEHRFLSAKEYDFDNKGKGLLIKTEMKPDSIREEALQWINLATNMITTISPSGIQIGEIDNICFGSQEEQLAFMIKGNDKTSIWYYESGMARAVMLVSNQHLGVANTLSMSSPLQFSKSGNWLFFNLQQPVSQQKPNPDNANVDIWSYNDEVLQPEQMRQFRQGPPSISAVVSTKGGNIIQVENDSETVQTFPAQVTGDFIVIASKYVEPWWKFSSQPSFYLVSLKDGSRKVIKRNKNSLDGFSFSPHGKYLVYYDREYRHYFSYELSNDSIRNITQRIKAKLNSEYSNIIHHAVSSIGSWHEQDSSLLIFDNYDIWEIDPIAKKSPLNITSGYGRQNHIKFRLAYMGDESNIKTFRRSDTLLITAFNVVNKYNGFYQKIMNQKGNPELLTMGPYTYYHLASHVSVIEDEFDAGMEPLKASAANYWVMKRHTSTEAPNYFLTKDFIRYTPLTDLQPQKKYNWLTSELIIWKMLDGRTAQGVLYKPENFNPLKKYPVIFNYYEELSYRLYEFPNPGLTEHTINIPWFVSRGYLVFTPDIYYEPANTSGKVVGEWAYNSVVSAAQHLSKMPFVDSKKLGLQGHSFGGLETNYLITHTSLFAAAADAAGSSDPISAYLTLVPLVGGIEHFNKQTGIEMGHELYGATPWERPDLYQKNSAVLNADKVSTPLLIMHNMKDNQVQWRQGVELFMGLRRLGKKVWMLQYDEGNHGVRGKDALDYTIRLNQFFDHYLKETPAPKWMTQGVKASRKGIDTGYDLDVQKIK